MAGIGMARWSCESALVLGGLEAVLATRHTRGLARLRHRNDSTTCWDAAPLSGLLTRFIHESMPFETP